MRDSQGLTLDERADFESLSRFRAMQKYLCLYFNKEDTAEYIIKTLDNCIENLQKRTANVKCN